MVKKKQYVNQLILNNRINKIKKIMKLFNLNNIAEFNRFVKEYNIVYDYFSNKNMIKVRSLYNIVDFYNNLPTKITYNDIVNDNKKKNIVPTLFKLSSISYNSNILYHTTYLEKYIIKTSSKLFILLCIKDTLFVVFRGSRYYSEIKKATTGSNRTRYIFNNKDTHNKFLIWKENFLKEFIRYTGNKTDVPELKHTNLYVHANYYRKSNIIIKQLKTVIDKLKKQNVNNIILLGHSMGGSLAMICEFRSTYCFIIFI